jgi:hypothetical protein
VAWGKLLQLASANVVALSAAELVAPPAGGATPSELPKAQYEGILRFGAADVNCYVLSDGQRVISRTSATTALSGVKRGGDLLSYTGAEALRPYLGVNLEDEFVQFWLFGVENKNVYGITAEVFLAICKAYQAANTDDALHTDRQREIGKQASSFLAACSSVGLTALIDEVTGYQYCASGSRTTRQTPQRWRRPTRERCRGTPMNGVSRHRSGAGDGNRTRTVSLEVAASQTPMAAC